MILVTTEQALPISETTAQIFYVRNEDYFDIVYVPQFRQEFLLALGKDWVIVERLGHEIIESKLFEKVEVEVKLPQVPVVKEMGYYRKL